jgi:hypothetical protein
MAHFVQDNGEIPESAALVHHEKNFVLGAPPEVLPNLLRQVRTRDLGVSKVDSAVPTEHNPHGIIAKRPRHGSCMMGDVAIECQTVMGGRIHHKKYQQNKDATEHRLPKGGRIDTREKRVPLAAQSAVSHAEL